MGLTSQFTTGQQAVTTVATALNGGSLTQFTAGVKLTCLSNSTASLFMGTAGVTTSTGDELPPGSSVVLPISDVSGLYVVATANSTTMISWLGVY